MKPHAMPHRLSAARQAAGAALVVGATALGGWPVLAAAAIVVAAWVWRLASSRDRAPAVSPQDSGEGTPPSAPAPSSAPLAPTSADDLISRLVELQLDYLTDLNSRRVLPRALADIQVLSRASFVVIGEVRVSSTGSSYVELLESEAVCWSDSIAADEASSAFRAVSRDITPVLDAVVARGEVVAIDERHALPGLSASFVQRGCLAVPLHVDGRLVGVVAVGECPRGSCADVVRPLTPYLRLCAGLIAAAKHQAQHEQMVEEAKARETLYRDLFDSASDLIHAVRPDGGFAYVNKAWLKTMGYAESELEELRVWDVVDEAAHTFYRTVFALASPGAPPESREMTFIAKDGRHIAVEGAEGCRFVDGVPAVTRAIFRDVTRRNAEEDALRAAKAAAEEAARAKSLFLANMSHELRTPMNAVIGMTDLLSDTAVSPDQRELISTIRKAGESLLDIINNILDFSKIESGKLQLERTPFDVRDAVEDAIDLVAQAAAHKGLDVAYALSPGVADAVVGDVTRFKQILVNLVTNAVKFTSVGEVVITVDGHPRDTDYELYVRVRDTGIGIPPDRVNHLFQSFTQVDAGTTRQFGGTGLGLAICRRLAELMGGSIWVESQLGVGSVFHFTVLVKASARPAASAPSHGAGSLTGKRVLIVAERPTSRRVLLDHVSAWGMLASAFVDGDHALADVGLGSEYDLVVLDTHPSFEDAIEVLLSLRSHDRFARLPAVFLGEVGRVGEVVEGLERYTWAAKPIKQRALQRALVDALEGRTPAVRPLHATAAVSRHADRLLLTEDNAINQQVALRMLARMGYVADVADNGAAAVEAVARTAYDIVLMDVQMPVLDGFTATAQIRAAHADGEQPYIIGMTALALAGDRERCLASGMDDYVAKPIRPELLQAALDRAVARRRGRAYEAGGTESGGPVGPLVAHGDSSASAITHALARALPASLPTPVSDEAPPAAVVAESATSAARPAHEDATAMWDPSALARLRELAGPSDTAFARGLVERWLCEYPTKVEAIGAALDAGDVASAERVAHTLKSSCGILGATKMARVCQEIESAAAQGRTDIARSALRELSNAASATEPLLTAEAGLAIARPA